MINRSEDVTFYHDRNIHVFVQQIAHLLASVQSKALAKEPKEELSSRERIILCGDHKTVGQ